MVRVENYDANPKPQFQWFLDDGSSFDFEEIKSSNDDLSNSIKYKAKIEDSGRRLICQIIQIDDNGNEVEF